MAAWLSSRDSGSDLETRIYLWLLYLLVLNVGNGWVAGEMVIDIYRKLLYLVQEKSPPGPVSRKKAINTYWCLVGNGWEWGEWDDY
jgi:hypothetical protein